MTNKKCIFYVCETDFSERSINEPNYAHEILNIYLFTQNKDNSHGLFLRFNITNNEFELWKVYNKVIIVNSPPIMISMNAAIVGGASVNPTGKRKVHYRSPILSDVLSEANNLLKIRYEYDDETPQLQQCKHKYPCKSKKCIKNKVKL